MIENARSDQIALQSDRRVLWSSAYVTSAAAMRVSDLGSVDSKPALRYAAASPGARIRLRIAPRAEVRLCRKADAGF
jgi:hypothetical protein